MTPQRKTRRPASKRAKAPTVARVPLPNFIPVEIGPDGVGPTNQFVRLLELIRAQETPEWDPNDVLFLNFCGGQYDPAMPVHVAPAARTFLQGLATGVGAHVSFVGYARGLDITEESIAFITLRPIQQILGRAGTANALYSLCRRALRHMYPNMEMLYGVDTQLLGLVSLTSGIPVRRSMEDRLEALGRQLLFFRPVGELASKATVYRGNVGYFSVQELEVGGTLRRVIAFCGDDGYPRIVTQLPSRKAVSRS